MTVLRLSAVLVLALALTGCNTVRRVLPFVPERDQGPQATATEGRRISVIEFDESLAPAEALAGVAFEIPAPVPVAAWPLPGGTPQQSVEHVEAAPAFEVAWRRRIGSGSSRGQQITAPPIAANGRVFAMDADSTVSAFDAATGQQAWRVDVRPSGGRDRAYGGGIAYADGRIYVASGYRFVAAIDAANGGLIWRTPVDTPIHGAPTVSGGRVFVVSTDDEVFSIDAATGTLAWTHQALVEPARFAIASSPAVADDVVVAPFASGELIALRAQNGNELWTDVLSRSSRNTALSEIRDIAGRPVIYRGDVYAVSHSGVFSATDLRTGERRWSLPVSGLTTPLPAGDVVYIMAKSGELIAAARDSGQVYWVADLNEGRVEKRGGVFGLWDREVRPVWSGPLLASNRLVFVHTRGEAVAVDPRTGAVQKAIRLGSPAFITPIAAGGMIYVVTENGELIAIR